MSGADGPAEPFPAEKADPAERTDPAAAAAAPHAAARWRGDVRTAVRVLALCLVVGLVVGALWARVAPRAGVVVTGDGVELVDPGTGAFIAADGWFAVLGGVAGLLCGLIGVRWWRRDGIGLSVGQAVGGIAGAWVAMALGERLGRAALDPGAPEGTMIEAALRVRATGVLLVWPMVALLVVLAVAVTFGLDEPEPPPDPDVGPGEPAAAATDAPPGPAAPA